MSAVVGVTSLVCIGSSSGLELATSRQDVTPPAKDWMSLSPKDRIRLEIRRPRQDPLVQIICISIVGYNMGIKRSPPYTQTHKETQTFLLLSLTMLVWWYCYAESVVYIL